MYRDTLIVLSTVIITAVLLVGIVLVTAFGYLDRINVGYFLLGVFSVAGVIFLITILGYLLTDNH